MKLFKWEIVRSNLRQKTFVQYILVGGQLGFCSITVGQLTGGNRRLATRRTTVLTSPLGIGIAIFAVHEPIFTKYISSY